MSEVKIRVCDRCGERVQVGGYRKVNANMHDYDLCASKCYPLLASLLKGEKTTAPKIKKVTW